MKEKASPRIHYCWLILFTCCMIYGASMGLCANCIGIYYAGITADNNWPMVMMTTLAIACTISRLGATKAADKIFNKCRLKTVLAVAILVYCGGYFLKSFTGGAVIFVIANILIGAGGAFLLYIPVPMLINNWFVERKSTALGIAMLSSGLMAAVASPIYTGLMEKYGWRVANGVNAVSALVVMLPAQA